MKRLFALACLSLMAFAGAARAGSIGLGVYAGPSIPVLQDDVDRGTMMGVRVPVKLVPMLALEPFWASSSLGDKTTDVAGVSYTRQGFDEKAWGVNAMLSTGGPIQFYPFAGVGRTTLQRTGTDLALTTYQGGIGIGLSPIPSLSLHLRGELQAAVDGGTTRKFANVTLGASYALLRLP